MMAGLQGSGKTTASAKLARLLKSQNRRPLLVGADLQRPAAVEQLRVLGERIGVPVYSEPTDPVSVARGALEEAARLGRDVVIVDTAGRLQIDAELMDELRAGARRRAAERHAARGRRHDRSGGGERRHRVRRGGRPHRRGPHQDRRRRARWCGAVGEGGRRQADPLRGYRREARRVRAVPPRPHGEPHPRHGRRAHAHREGRGDVRPGGDGEDGAEAPQGPAHAGGLPRPDAPGASHGPAAERARRCSRACPRRSRTRRSTTARSTASRRSSAR